MQQVSRFVGIVNELVGFYATDPEIKKAESL